MAAVIVRVVRAVRDRRAHIYLLNAIRTLAQKHADLFGRLFVAASSRFRWIEAIDPGFLSSSLLH